VSDRPDDAAAAAAALSRAGGQRLAPRAGRLDALVTRRESLRMLATLSGGLLAGSAAVGAGLFRRPGLETAPPRRVAASIEPGQAVVFSYPTDDDPAIAVRLPDGTLVAYSSVCTHLGCAVLWSAERRQLECPCHKGVFDAHSGGVAAGPPPRGLSRIRLEERVDGIYAT
jgi:nitrite reductase/ring-hydroxylating ferredoxin subunit